MKNRKVLNTLAAVLIACIPAGTLGQSSKTKQDKATSELVTAANQYKSSVESLIPVHEDELKTATETLEKRKELFEQGFISKRELEESEQAVKAAQAHIEQARKQISESDELIAQAKAEQEMASRKIVVPSRASSAYSTTAAMMRYNGTASWSLSNASKVQSFFSSTFGRQLPISAYGQSATHNRMGLNHSNALDVAVHPDSAEGKALIVYLRSNGIPYIAFRSAVPGAATGAHIHIGRPSSRL